MQDYLVHCLILRQTIQVLYTLVNPSTKIYFIFLSFLQPRIGSGPLYRQSHVSQGFESFSSGAHKVQKQYSVYFSPKKKKKCHYCSRSLWVVAGINDESSMALSSSSQLLATQSPPSLHFIRILIITVTPHQPQPLPSLCKGSKKHLKLIRHPLES